MFLCHLLTNSFAIVLNQYVIEGVADILSFFSTVKVILILLSGGLFEEANSMEEIAFKYAVDHINRLLDIYNIYSIYNICNIYNICTPHQEQAAAQVPGDGPDWEDTKPRLILRQQER